MGKWQKTASVLHQEELYDNQRVVKFPAAENKAAFLML